MSKRDATAAGLQLTGVGIAIVVAWSVAALLGWLALGGAMFAVGLVVERER